MKKLTLILCVVVAMALTSMAFAQTATPPQKQTPAQTTKVPAPTKAPAPAKAPAAVKKTVTPVAEQKKMVEKTMIGKVVSVDAVANTVVVTHGKKGDVTFQAEPTTKIMIAGKEAKLADIQKGSKVTITYKLEGQKRIASAIKCK